MSSRFSKSVARKMLAGLLGAALGSAAIWGYRNRRLFTVSDITTGDSLEYPELRAHVYYATPELALEAALQAIESLPNFRVVLHDAAQIVVEAETQIGRFIDDVIVKALPLGSRHTRVVIRSRSRMSSGDLGENARHIRALQSAMDGILVGG